MTQETGDGTIIQIAASLSEIGQLSSDLIHEADAIEIRLDLMPDLTCEQVETLARSYHGPIILTLRSREEGGAFDGDSSAWMKTVMPFLPLVTMVDVEIRYREHARQIHEMGRTIIASCHKQEMLRHDALISLYRDLRSFGDIPKIAVSPENSQDLLSLLHFTNTADKPVIVSVTGTICRYARPLLPLFGSLFTYCYLDKPTSPGQYSIREMQMLSELLAPGIIDTWFTGSPENSSDTSPFNRYADESDN